MYRFSAANDSNLAEVTRLVNAHEKSVDPDASSMGESGVRQLMSGYIDDAMGFAMRAPGSDRILAFVQPHPDANRGMYFPDIYCDPTVPELASATAAAVDFLMEHTLAANPTWALRPGMNTKDSLLTDTYANRGFTFLRKFWSLTRPLTEQDRAPLEQLNFGSGVEVRQIMDTPSDLELLHRLHQDAFSTHFGFKARDRDSWIALELARETREPAGNVFLLADHEPVGFLLSANEMLHENGGYIDLLGVKHSAHGRGYGKSLLQWAIAYNANLGREKVNLNVDTGNTSGALQVYEKVGFRPYSAWQQYELKRG